MTEENLPPPQNPGTPPQRPKPPLPPTPPPVRPVAPQQPKRPAPPPPASGKEKLIRNLNRRWVLVGALVVVTLFAFLLTVNDLMRALLHSRTEVIVPDLEQKSVLEALDLVSPLDLSIIQEGSEFDESLPAGTIVRQIPPAGMEVRSGRPIRVVISKGGQVLFVPLIIGDALAEAQSKLASDGIQLGAVTESFSDLFVSGVTISQSPSSGTIVTRGALVDIEVSKGPPPAGAALVPNFIGVSLNRVRDWAESVGARVKITEDKSSLGRPGTVVRQRPAEEQPLVDDIIRVTIVPLLASEQGFRFSYRVPRDVGEVEVKIQARNNRGEFDVYTGTHKGGSKIEIPMTVESTTRVRIFLDDRLSQERVVEP